MTRRILAVARDASYPFGPLTTLAMSEETTTSQTTGMQEPITESMASEESLLASPPAPGLATSGEAMAQTGGTGKRLFVAVGDGYSGYYAVEGKAAGGTFRGNRDLTRVT